jgi:hypothetical protein
MSAPFPDLSQSVGRWTSLVLVSLVGLFLLQKFRDWYRLRHFKGPFVASLSRLWLTRCVAGGTMHLDFLDVNRKYVCIVRDGAHMIRP